MGNSILYRMPSGIAGDVSRKSQSTIEAHPTGGQLAAFGVFGKLNAAGKFAPLAAGDAAASIYGLIVRAYPTQSISNGLGAAQPAADGICDVLVRGYMTVKNNAGAVKKGGKVYVRIATPTQAKPVGGIEAVADGANTIEAKAIFMHDADAEGNVEIAFNI